MGGVGGKAIRTLYALKQIFLGIAFPCPNFPSVVNADNIFEGEFTKPVDLRLPPVSPDGGGEEGAIPLCRSVPGPHQVRPHYQ